MAGNLFEAIREMLMGGGKPPVAISSPLPSQNPFGGTNISQLDNRAQELLNQDIAQVQPQFRVPQNATPPIAPVQQEEPSIFSKFNTMMRDPEKNAQIVLALNSMRSRPDTSLAASMQKRIDAAQATKLLQMQTNKTVEQLRSIGTPEATQAADLIVANPQLAKEILGKYYAESMKPVEKTSQMSGEQLNAMSGSAVYDPKKMYNVVSSSSGTKVTGIGGGDTNISLTDTVEGAGLKKEAEERAKLGTQYISDAMTVGKTAGELANSLDLLMALGESKDLNSVPNYLRKFIPEGFSDTKDAYQSVLYSVAKAQRQAGTGAQSDKDFDVLVAQSGAISNDIRARRITQQALLEKAKIDKERANVASQYMAGELSQAEAIKELSKLNNKSIFTPEMKSYLLDLTGGKSTSDIPRPEGVSESEWNYMTDQQKELFRGSN